jgi:hypothetical protein
MRQAGRFPEGIFLWNDQAAAVLQGRTAIAMSRCVCLAKRISLSRRIIQYPFYKICCNGCGVVFIFSIKPWM